MDTKKKMDAARLKIDALDSEIVDLFVKRMKLSDHIAKIKSEGNIALTDDIREQIVVDKAVEIADLETKEETVLFMRSLMAISKLRQRKLIYGDQGPDLLPPSRKPVTEDSKVAYQGLPGAWGEQAAIQACPEAERMICDRFEAVFAAVKEGKANYGVVPIENSQTGAIGEVYDLLRRYGCYIVGQTWVDVKHCLMGIPGTKLTDIREVFSHPEGFRQCEDFLKNRPWDMTACSNTATAADRVAKAGVTRFAAIGSRRAAELNGLEVLMPDIASDQSNRTRFIMIAGPTGI